MSQASKGSTKLMIIVWAVTMFFIGYKALSSSNEESSSSDALIDSALLERIKPIGEVRIDSSIVVASSENSEKVARSGEEIYNDNCQG